MCDDFWDIRDFWEIRDATVNEGKRENSIGEVVQYNTCAYSSVHRPRWCADSWDTMEQSELPQMQSLEVA